MRITINFVDPNVPSSKFVNYRVSTPQLTVDLEIVTVAS
jgi:hypothetical protein